MGKATFLKKICTPQDCLQHIESGKLARPIVFTNGVFDILHRGHVSYLDEARQLGGSLIAALNTDDSVRRLGKAPERPFNPLEDRCVMLAALESVSAVTWFADDTPLALIGQLKPDLIVKGGDYDMAVLPETALVESWGGQAKAIDFETGYSTTSLVEKIRASLQRHIDPH